MKVRTGMGTMLVQKWQLCLKSGALSISFILNARQLLLNHIRLQDHLIQGGGKTSCVLIQNVPVPYIHGNVQMSYNTCRRKQRGYTLVFPYWSSQYVRVYLILIVRELLFRERPHSEINAHCLLFSCTGRISLTTEKDKSKQRSWV